MVHIGHWELFVQDPLASLTFYRDLLGCTVTEIQDGRFVWLALDNVELLLRPGPSRALTRTYTQHPIGIVLYTENLPGILARLQAAGVTYTPMDESPGCYTFTDADGHWFQLVDPN